MLLKKLSLVGVLALGLVGSASALNITPATVPQWTGANNNNMNANQVAAAIGVANNSLTAVYTQNVGGTEEGSFKTSYNTTFSNSPQDPSAALIDYISGSSITGNSIYLYVKDGNQNPAWYIFNISSWNGTEDLVLSGFWPEQGAISHVTILTGTSSGGDRVPDAGGTLALFGLALGSLSLVRRKLGAK